MSPWITFALGFAYGWGMCWLVFQLAYRMGIVEWRGAASKGGGKP